MSSVSVARIASMSRLVRRDQCRDCLAWRHEMVLPTEVTQGGDGTSAPVPWFCDRARPRWREPTSLARGVRRRAAASWRLRDHVRSPGRAGLRTTRVWRRMPRTPSIQASTRTHAGRTRRCTARSSGRCACSPGSAPRPTPTAAFTSCSPQEATACRPRSTCRR